VFVLSVGQSGVERVYIEYTGQTREEAEKTLKRTQRARIIGYRLARPSSHYAAAREERERTWPEKLAEAQEKLAAGGKRRRVVYRDK
jgi:hypothetical protein